MEPYTSRHRLLLAVVLSASALPLVTRIVAEATLVTAMLVALPARAWWLLSWSVALVVWKWIPRRARPLALLPPLAVGVLTWAPSPPLEPGPDGLRIAAWNLAKGTLGTSAQLRDGLAALDADVVCLSEAGRYEWLPDFAVEGLARAMGFVVVGEGEVRALVRQAPASVRSIPLPPGPSRRPLLVVELEHAGRSWRVGCLHLMPRLFFESESVDRGEAHRGSWSVIAAAVWAQGKRLRTVVDHEARAGQPIDVLAGDWNHQAFGRVVGGLVTDGYVDAIARDEGPTFGQLVWAKRIDHVLVHDRVALRGAHIHRLAGSDHATVVVDVGARAPFSVREPR